MKDIELNIASEDLKQEIYQRALAKGVSEQELVRDLLRGSLELPEHRAETKNPTIGSVRAEAEVLSELITKVMSDFEERNSVKADIELGDVREMIGRGELKEYQLKLRL